MQKQTYRPQDNNYSFLSLMKSGAVFFSTTMSYWLLSSLNMRLSAAKAWNREETYATEKNPNATFAFSNKRVAQQLQLKPVQPALSNFNLSLLNGANGFSVTGGLAMFNQLGSSVSTAGDFNGDGLADLVLSAPSASSGSGVVYVLFGKANGWPVTVNLTTLNGANGFSVPGLTTNDHIGSSVSTAGDFNGDGLADLVLGAAPVSGNAGAVYVLFGKADGWPAAFNLATLNGTNGFRVPGLVIGDLLGGAVSTAGNFNGDSCEDLVLGAYGASNYDGTVYVLFGKTNGWAATFNLTSLNGTNGFVIPSVPGLAINNYLGGSVSTAGDLNEDGLTDLVLGAYGALGSAGVVYVLFGKTNGWPATFDLATLNGTNGFAMPGLATNGWLGYSVSTAGDFNRDGFADLVLGAPTFSGFSAFAGAVYLLLGNANGWPATFNLAMLNGSNGFRVQGLATSDQLGYSVSTAGDFNGDGLDDLMLGAYLASGTAGTVYIVFGKANGLPAAFNLATLNGTNGFRVQGLGTNFRLGSSVSTAGDLNGDGLDDLVLGADSGFAGGVYVLFGSPYTSFFIVSNQLSLAQGQVVTLSFANLNVVYTLNGNISALCYTPSNVQGGYFQLVTNAGINIVNFTQSDLTNQLVQFVHDGTINPPLYQIQVSDGTWETPVSMPNISFVRGVPSTLVNYAFTVFKGVAVILTSNELSAADPNPYGSNASLIFLISNLQHGRFELVSQPGMAVMQFTPQQIAMNNVQFIPDGGDTAPVVIVQVNNSFSLVSAATPVVITFYNNVSNTMTPGDSADNTLAIAGGIAGSTVLLAGVIGGGFWYRKRTQDHKTRKQHPFADYVRDALKLRGVDDFNSDRGQRYVAVIQKLANEFSQQGTSLANRGDNELKSIAQNVARAARNKITYSTTLFGYSEITIEDLDNKIADIVQEVIRRRAGLDDTSMPMKSF